MAALRASGVLSFVACVAVTFWGSANALVCRYYEVDKAMPWDPGEEFEGFAYAMAADGDRLAVGAIEHDSSLLNGGG